ncbi:hypothetical protein CC1G_07484 [Coprinopsis cinerea okayama7|uniref:Mid2 domain-containing protein n=1 Tax=Coprinopsis cinerea (strain Okayama-7 / 130 / ATCC MYA-4618 / FGSC 9003) TaxID=240176 RepID=A8NBB4_COPC7|nr:hypothetical protein CC1G_07484 [Coprinopsis cinerea okayama7\|eukprot:XP_001832113.2 hypothetical protein CC1G_07484 [Coprinopsis cinerea okayama7\
MSVYKDAPDTMVIYDRAGVRLQGNVVGSGTAACVCFSLADLGGERRADICVYFNERGLVQEEYRGFSGGGSGPGPPSGSYLMATVSPNSAKALPQCRDVDLPARSAEWAATALGVRGSPIAAASQTTPRTSTERISGLVSSPTPSSSPVSTSPASSHSSDISGGIQTSLSASVDSGGTTHTHTYFLPTTVVIKSATDSEKEGISLSDKIALGVGLGLGIPTLVIAVLGVVSKCRRKRPASSGSDGQDDSSIEIGLRESPRRSWRRESESASSESPGNWEVMQSRQQQYGQDSAHGELMDLR